MNPGYLTLAGLTVIVLLIAVAGPAAGYEQRPNTVSLGLQGGVGFMSGSGEYEWKSDQGVPVSYFYGDFDLGPSLGIRLRYSLDRSQAIGISWEDQRYWRKSGKPNEIAGTYQITTFAADYYIYINRPKKLCQYAVLGAGFFWNTFRFDDNDGAHGEHVSPPEAPFFMANLGFGVEYFLSRPLSVDASVRGYLMRAEGGNSMTGQLQIGFQYYLLR